MLTSSIAAALYSKIDYCSTTKSITKSTAQKTNTFFKFTVLIQQHCFLRKECATIYFEKDEIAGNCTIKAELKSGSICQTNSKVSNVKLSVVFAYENVTKNPQLLWGVQTHEPRDALRPWHLNDVVLALQLELVARELEGDVGETGDRLAGDFKLPCSRISFLGANSKVDGVCLAAWAGYQAGTCVQDGLAASRTGQAVVRPNKEAVCIDMFLILSLSKNGLILRLHLDLPISS